MMRAALYNRVSTSIQVEEGYSLDAQLDRLRAYCDSQGWSIVDIYTDEGLSAKNTERPGLQRLLKDVAAKKIDVVLVYKLDRLTRSVTNLYELIQKFEAHGVGFKSATEVFDTTTAMGRLFITIVAALAQWERENLAERTKMGQIEMTKQGKWSGGNAAFGYRYIDGQLVIEESEAGVVREIFRRYLSGQGTRVMLNWLNNPVHPQLAPNARWTQTAIKYVLRNPLYAGMVRYGLRTIGGKRQKNPLVMPGNQEPIISLADFERSEQMRQQRSTMPRRAGTGTYSLSGLLYCGLCGASMSGRTSYRATKAGQKQHRTYTCVERMHSKLCSLPLCREGVLEAELLNALDRYSQDLSSQIDTIDLSDPKETQKERQLLEVERRKIETRRKRWMDAFEEGSITSSELRERLDQLQDREHQILVNLDKIDTEDKPALNLVMLQSVLHTFRDTWSVAEVSERKELLRIIIKRIEVFPGPDLKIIYHV